MKTRSTASCMGMAEVLAFSPASRQAGFDDGCGQQVRGFSSCCLQEGSIEPGAGLNRLHGLKVPLIDMRLRVCDDATSWSAAMVIARLDGRIMAILLDEGADLLPAGAARSGAVQDCLLGVAEPGQHSMVLLALEKLAPPVPMA